MDLNARPRMLVVFSLLAAMIASITLASAAQARQPDQETRAAMKKLEFITGKWKGKGSIQIKGKRDTFDQTEDIRFKLGGMLLLIEGKGHQKNMETGEQEVVHHALAVVSYDKQTGNYRFRSYLADGRATEAQARLVAKHQLVWIMPLQDGAKMRYTIRLTEDGRWQEIGEYSRKGKSWFKTFEMTLTRSET